MPSGRTVTARANCKIFTSSSCFLSLSLCVLGDDKYNSEGLCGNYNDIRGDDLIPQDWSKPDPNYLEPVLFSSSYL